jgi:Ca2+-binding RTX toxin-like protein
MHGGAGNDTYYVDNASDQVIEAAGGGTDTVYVSADFTLGAGQEIEKLIVRGSVGRTLGGNELANALYGSTGSDTLNGGDGNDRLDGRAGADLMAGGNGNDICYVDNASDQVTEAVGGGTDLVYASANFTLGAGQEIEKLRVQGSAGLTLTGNGLKNNLIGGAGGDTLNGGAGNDTLKGMGGSDIFSFNTALGAANIDHILDYSVAADTIQLENAVFTGLAGGTLAVGAFFIGSAAHDTDDRIVYNSATGALFYDSNGNGAGGSIQFATVAAGLAMTNSEFSII